MQHLLGLMLYVLKVRGALQRHVSEIAAFELFGAVLELGFSEFALEGQLEVQGVQVHSWRLHEEGVVRLLGVVAEYGPEAECKQHALLGLSL